MDTSKHTLEFTFKQTNIKVGADVVSVDKLYIKPLTGHQAKLCVFLQSSFEDANQRFQKLARETVNFASKKDSPTQKQAVELSKNRQEDSIPEEDSEDIKRKTVSYIVENFSDPEKIEKIHLEVENYITNGGALFKGKDGKMRDFGYVDYDRILDDIKTGPFFLNTVVGFLSAATIMPY